MATKESRILIQRHGKRDSSLTLRMTDSIGRAERTLRDYLASGHFMLKIPKGKKDRIDFVLDFAWEIFFMRVISGRIKVNKESSMQLHYSAIAHGLGEIMATEQNEIFNIELESALGRKNVDIICSYNELRAAVELKCFRKASNRACDIDMYKVLNDIERLESYSDFQVRKFICLTDNPYYITGKHDGYASSVSIRQGKQYKKDEPICPGWSGKWKDKSCDKSIILRKDLTMSWVEESGWYFLKLNV